MSTICNTQTALPQYRGLKIFIVGIIYFAAHTLPKQKKRTRPSDSMVVRRSPGTTDTYRAIKDYNPEHFSWSGHQRLELSLKEGDLVKVLGEQHFIFVWRGAGIYKLHK